MPTDGTLLLEHMPKEKQYLVTALSIFFSFGAVLSAAVALLVLPQNSCPAGQTVPCDVDLQNRGWQYLLITLALIVCIFSFPFRYPFIAFITQTLTMFLARMVFFHLHESPRYLVHAGRPQDALKSLQMISKFNGSDLEIELEDVRDHYRPVDVNEEDPQKLDHSRIRATSRTIFDARVIEDGPVRSSRESSTESTRAVRPGLVTAYSSTGQTHGHKEPLEVAVEQLIANADANRRRRLSTASRRSSIYERKVYGALPRWIRKPLWAWRDRVMMVLAPEWLRTTVLVWSAWCSMALGLLNVGLGDRGPFVLTKCPQPTPCSTFIFRNCWKLGTAAGTAAHRL